MIPGLGFYNGRVFVRLVTIYDVLNLLAEGTIDKQLIYIEKKS